MQTKGNTMATLRTSDTTHKNLKELSILTGLPMQTVLDQAISAYQKDIFLEKLNEDFAALRANPKAWQEEQGERELWEQSLSDGLISPEWSDAG
ncbi:MAG: toxin-antitoxin system protein [Armatimonadetes bacterium]|nr:toxin-antitoxin system protein [Armatimonadota bacterium]